MAHSAALPKKTFNKFFSTSILIFLLISYFVSSARACHNLYLFDLTLIKTLNRSCLPQKGVSRRSQLVLHGVEIHLWLGK